MSSKNFSYYFGVLSLLGGAMMLAPQIVLADGVGVSLLEATRGDFLGLSPLQQLLVVFVGGIASSFTPCVYPLIPITLAVLGASNEQSRVRAFFLSVSYVLGIAVTFTLLGMISALTGSLFGAYLGNPFVIVAGCLLLVLLGMSALDVLPFNILQPLQRRASAIGGSGLFGGFLMGTASGVIAAPCIGPLLVVILGLAAASQQAAWGALLLFTYALGLGVLFVALGVSSRMLRHIPRGGSWMLAVKFVLAVAIFMVATFLSSPLRGAFSAGPLPFDRTSALLLMAVGALGLALIAFRADRKFLKVCAAALLGFSLFEIGSPLSYDVAASENSQGREIAWELSVDTALPLARDRSTIVMLDLYASWCASCKDFDGITFRDPLVTERMKSLVPARIDLTVGDELTDKLQDRYEVVGLPAILFLNPDGSEVPNSRITGFLTPPAFIAHLDKVVGPEASREHLALLDRLSR